MTKRILVPVADGSEDLETSAIIDVLARAGCRVVTASVMPDGSHGVVMAKGMCLTADKHISEVLHEHFDAVVIPGGMPGASYIGKSSEAQRMIAHLKKHKRLVAAICAAPFATLGRVKGVYEGVHTVAVYPKDEFESGLRDLGVDIADQPVVYSGGILTARGPGVAVDFALRAAAILVGEDAASRVREQMLCPKPTPAP